MIKNRILTAAVMPLLAVLCLVSCGKENIPEVKEPAKAVSWTPNAESLTISVGETATVSGETVFDDGTKTEQEALCTSKDDKIVFADGGYSIVGLAPGTAYVSAWVAYYAAGDISAPIAVFQKDIQVTVKGDGTEVTALELSPAEVTLKRGEEVTLKIYASYPDGTKREISPKVCRWSVTDDGEQHIIYDSDGKVRGMQGTGETILTAEYTENGVTIRGSSKIIVND